MKNHSRTQLVIAIWLVAAVPICFTFSHYYPLSNADFLSSLFKIETPDELNLPSGLLDNKWKTLASNGSTILFPPRLHPFLKSLTASPQLISLEQGNSILRC